MSDQFPWLAVQAADPNDRATGRIHAMGSGLRFAFALTVCGAEPLDPREPGMPMDAVRKLPRFENAPAAKQCRECVREIEDIEMADIL